MFNCLVFLKETNYINEVYLNMLNLNKCLNLYFHILETNSTYNRKKRVQLDCLNNILIKLNIDFIIVKIDDKTINQFDTLLKNLKFSKKIDCFTNTSLILNENVTHFLQIHKNDNITYIYKTLNINSSKNNICCNNIVQKVEKSKISKELGEFSELCMLYLKELPDVKNKLIQKQCSCEAVYIEFRNLEHSEYIIKNCISILDESWSHTVICCNDNYNLMMRLCNKINKNINIIKLNINSATYNDYNELLLTTNFWKLFYGEKILIYQSDSLIFNNTIVDFLKYDYIGTPFSNKNVILSDSSVGNGGLSLRTKQMMIDVLNNEKCEKKYSKIAESFKTRHNFTNIPEDVYFSQNMQNLKIGWVADEEGAKLFGMTRKNSDYKNCVGMHALWEHCHNWKDVLKTFMTNNKQKKYDVQSHTTVGQVNIVEEFGDNITNMSSYLNENLVNFTRQMGTSPIDFLDRCNKIDINIITDGILIVDFFNGGGGTTTFINFIVSKYKYYNNFFIIRNINHTYYLTLNDDYLIETFIDDLTFFDFIEKLIITKIFVNHLLFYSDMFFDNLCRYKTDKNIKMYTITHDYYMFLNKIQPTYQELKSGSVYISNRFNLNFFDEIITQNKCNLKYISKNITNDIHKFKIISLPDYYETDNHIEYKNKIYTVGIIGNINILKGGNEMKKLIEHFPDVKFVVFGLFDCNYKNLTKCPYNTVFELNKLLIQQKPNILLELSIWPETYGYAFTLSFLTSLPLIILNKLDTSVIIERNNNIRKNVFIAKDLSEIKKRIELFNKINNITKLYTINPKIHFNKYWNELFISEYSKNIETNKTPKINNLFSKYVIYFPQFHEIRVNNTLFYKNYTDITNLNILIKTNYLNEILTPNFVNFHMTSIEDYDLITNDNIICEQFKLLTDYNLDGLACYYYWFSTNNLDVDNMIMRKSVDKIFEMSTAYDKNIFFIWANEDWTKNSAMGLSDTKIIKNYYSNEDFILNFNNMLPYFNNKNYLKKQNCPVLMIYHSFVIQSDKIELLEYTFNNLCLKNGFSGIKIYWNTMQPLSLPEHFNNFYINFNYKNNNCCKFVENSQTYLDYEKYVDFCEKNIQNNIVQTVVFDFDNNARLIKPDRSHLSTVCVKNYHFLKIKFIKMIVNKYSSKTKNIVLINSLNEWGEKMAIEPSNEIGFYYLNLLNKYLENSY